MATLANWAAKTANLLTDGLGLPPGSVVGVGGGTHWQAVPVLFGCWQAGLLAHTTRSGDGPAPAAVFGTADELAAGPAGAELFEFTDDPFGVPAGGAPGGYPAAVRAFADRYQGPPVPPDRPAWLGVEGRRSGGELAAAAERLAAGWPGAASDPPAPLRVLSVAGPDRWAGVVPGLLAPLAGGGRVVLCHRPAADRLAGRADTELVTATVGLPLPGRPRLDD